MNTMGRGALGLIAASFVAACAAESGTTDVAPETQDDGIGELTSGPVEGWTVTSTRPYVSAAGGCVVVANSATNGGASTDTRFYGACLLKKRTGVTCVSDESCGPPGNYCFSGTCYAKVGSEFSCITGQQITLNPGQSGGITSCAQPAAGTYYTVSVLAKSGLCTNGAGQQVSCCASQAWQQDPTKCVRDLSAGAYVNPCQYGTC
jgi:hypothetical protein